VQLTAAYRGEMTEEVRRALATDPTIDITTTGRNTGDPRRIEIWMLEIDGRFFITGTPGPRGWLANLKTNPRLVVHMKHGMDADLVAWAHVVDDEQTRRRVLSDDAASWYRTQQPLDVLVASSPMVEVRFDQDY
jgi:deazaflavin-dependent oxidoreductase (nitroreductase family)